MRTEGGIQDVVRIEYDPGRSGHIALLKSRDPKAKQPWSYILAPEGLRAGHTVQSFRQGIPDGLVPGFVDLKKTSKAAEQLAADVNDAPAPVKSMFLGAMAAEGGVSISKIFALTKASSHSCMSVG